MDAVFRQMLTPGIRPHYGAKYVGWSANMAPLRVVRHDFPQCLGSSHRFGSSWWPSLPRLTSKRVPYRRFSQGLGAGTPIWHGPSPARRSAVCPVHFSTTGATSRPSTSNVLGLRVFVSTTNRRSFLPILTGTSNDLPLRNVEASQDQFGRDLRARFPGPAQSLRITIAILGHMGSFLSRANPTFALQFCDFPICVVTNTAHCY